MRAFRSLLVCLVFSLVLGACAGGPAELPTPYIPISIATPRPAGSAAPAMAPWPGEDWATARPEDQGIDPAKLDAMLAGIRSQKLDLHSLLIFRNGYLVSENYFNGGAPGQLHEIFSCTKSFASTLIGIAIDQGLIQSVDQKVVDFFPGRRFENLDAGKQAMTLENVLTMTSGLEWSDTGQAFQQMYASDDWVGHMLNLPMAAAPGERWNYCSGCSHLLTSIIDQVAPQGALKFAQKNLLEPLGIQDYRWELDADGIPIGGWGLRMNARDLARLGYLFLNEGRWADRQIVSAEWVRQATQGRYDTDSASLRYGYQWWVDTAHAGYYALGRDGQTIFVLPQKNLMVVTTAEMDGHSQIFDLIANAILPAVR